MEFRALKKLTIVRGLPGSGKSTVARKLRWELGHDHFEADMFFVTDGKYTFDAALCSEAHKWCKNQCIKSMKAGRSVVVANTFTAAWQATPYFEMAEEFGYEVEVITCTEDYGSVHNVPDETIARMKSIWEDDITPG